MKKLSKSFFARQPDIIAKELLGEILVRSLNNQMLKSKIVETEAYFGANDPASRASKGKNKISEMMWSDPGTIMIYNVHKYKMFNIVTGKLGEPSAVLIRAVQPLNFQARCEGPGLLTNSLKISRDLHGKSILKTKEIFILDNKENNEILTGFRIGVTKDLPEHYRYFIKK